MFLTPLLNRAGTHVLRAERSGALVAAQVEVAADSKSRRRGLLGRDGMAPDSALVIAPCGGIHTFWMRFPIDVLFVKKDGRIVRAVDSIGPWRIALSITAYAAVELPAGTIRRLEIGPGDRLVAAPGAA